MPGSFKIVLLMAECIIHLTEVSYTIPSRNLSLSFPLRLGEDSEWLDWKMIVFFPFLLVKLKICGFCFISTCGRLPRKVTFRARVTRVKRNELCDPTVTEYVLTLTNGGKKVKWRNGEILYCDTCAKVRGQLYGADSLLLPLHTGVKFKLLGLLSNTHKKMMTICM